MSANSPKHLTLGAWFPTSMPDDITLTRFTLPEEHYQTLLHWAPRSKKPGREQFTNVVLEGLSEILAFFVPEVSFMDGSFKNNAGRKRLAIYLLDAPADIDDVQLRMETAINLWLANIYPQKPAEMRIGIASSAWDSGQWEQRVPVSTALKTGSEVCAAPESGILFNALTALAVKTISGTNVRFRSGEDKTWIVQTPDSGIYNGVELVAFPPQLNSNDNTLYSEYISLRSASFPERAKQGIHIIAEASIRNWGPIKRYDKASDPTRSLDFFIPRSGASPSDYKRYAHSRIVYKAAVQNWDGVIHREEAKDIQPQWGRNNKRHVFDIVRQLIGAESISNAGFMSPVIDHNGAWSLPRLAPGSGDKWMAGGSGLGWHDRSDVAGSLDEPLASIGFRRAADMQRINPRPYSRNRAVTPYNRESTQKSDRPDLLANRRRWVLAAMRELGIAKALTFLVLHIRENTPSLVEDALVTELGPPDKKDRHSLVWTDGLVISVVAAHGGYFSQPLPDAGTAGQDLEGMTDAQAAQIKRSLQDEENKRTAMEMDAYLREHIGTLEGVGCAVVEMPASLRESTLLDPYQLGRRVLAQHNLLPKVVLWEEEAPDEKYRASVADCFRMLGVVPFNIDEVVIAPSAIGVVQRNRKKGRPTAQTGHSIPVAVRVWGGRLEGSLPNAQHAPEWMPYAHVVLGVMTGAYEDYGRGRNSGNKALFANYVNDVLERLNEGTTPTIVFLDGSTLRIVLPSLANGNLKFDALTVGYRTYTPLDIPRLTLVRINTNTDELPQYSHHGEVQWTEGLFRWEDAQRTAYGAKRRPKTVQAPASHMRDSRNDPEYSSSSRNRKHRKGSALDEMCVIFAQPQDDITLQQVITHKLRGKHAHYAEDTRLPFPLHELRVLSKAINS